MCLPIGLALSHEGGKSTQSCISSNWSESELTWGHLSLLPVTEGYCRANKRHRVTLNISFQPQLEFDSRRLNKPTDSYIYLEESSLQLGTQLYPPTIPIRGLHSTHWHNPHGCNVSRVHGPQGGWVPTVPPHIAQDVVGETPSVPPYASLMQLHLSRAAGRPIAGLLFSPTPIQPVIGCRFSPHLLHL